jgi:hypothetical protein
MILPSPNCPRRWDLILKGRDYVAWAISLILSQKSTSLAKMHQPLRPTIRRQGILNVERFGDVEERLESFITSSRM